MHKLLYFATIGLLAFSIGGCGDGGGGNTASPSPTPSAASPSPAAAASPTPGTQTFQSPVVAAGPSGLIRSTNPDQRAKQSQTGIDNKKNQPKNAPAGQPILPGPLTANPAQIDPFGPLPPIAVQNPGGAGGVPGGPMTANPLPKLVSRQIALLPKLPESSPPPAIGAPVLVTDRGSEIRSSLGTQQVAGGQGNPTLGGGTGTQIGSPRQIPGLNAPQLSRSSGDPTLGGGTGAQIGSPRQIPGLNAPQLGRRPVIPPALQPIAATPLGVPNLPALPVDKRPPQWRDPNPIARRVTSTPSRPALPRPPQPIAARPLGVPNLPPLPVDKRPPQWIDPNPPPVKQVPAIPAPPPPPSTDLATGTEVSGVVKVGNETQVIVKVPNEPTSRYVKVGQRLSNGKVLVKRVDVKSGADPIVILEENGVEVAKAVGEKPPSREPKPANAVISSLPNANRATGR